MNNTTNTSNPPASGLPSNKILVGDATRLLRGLASKSVDTVVTSPPYFLLRDYGVKGQIGLEDSIDGWVDQLVAVLDEVARVLKPQGSVWLNLGDTYARQARHGAPAKSLVLGPEKLLLALSERGWIVRNKIVWVKPNPLPASVRDRLNTTWEPLFLLTRQRDYFFDLDAIRIPPRSRLAGPSVAGESTKYGVRAKRRPSWSGPLAGSNSGLEKMKAQGLASHPLGKNPGDVWTIPTAAYKGAHFATFPQALVERPLKATCPERVCRACGTAWRRAPVERTLGSLAILGTLRKSCGCEDPVWQPGIVLDPFMGAGTVGIVAERINRRWLGLELSDAFARQADERIRRARYAA